MASDFAPVDGYGHTVMDISNGRVYAAIWKDDPRNVIAYAYVRAEIAPAVLRDMAVSIRKAEAEIVETGRPVQLRLMLDL